MASAASDLPICDLFMVRPWGSPLLMLMLTPNHIRGAMKAKGKKDLDDVRDFGNVVWLAWLMTASSSHKPPAFGSATSMAQLRSPACAWPRGKAQMPAALQTLTCPQFYLTTCFSHGIFTTCSIIWWNLESLQFQGPCFIWFWSDFHINSSSAHLATLRHRLWKSRKAASSSPSAPSLCSASINNQGQIGKRLKNKFGKNGRLWNIEGKLWGGGPWRIKASRLSDWRSLH